MEGSVMNNSEGPASGFTPSTENTAGKMIRPAITATHVSMTDTLSAVFPNLVSLLK